MCHNNHSMVSFQNNKQLQVIGPRVKVDFLTAKIFDVPAKIDTGADYSSVWASNIRLEGKTLLFCLFDRQSPFFTGEELSTTNFTTIKVKNSFGQSQTRYKIPLNIQLHGRTIKANFTLADRSRNSYPVLIGRRTLKGKFLVDVAGQHEAGRPLEVLILCHAAKQKTIDRLKTIEEKLGDKIKIEVAKYKDLAVNVNSKELSIRLMGSNRDLASYGFIFFLTRTKDAELASIIASYAKRQGVSFSDQAAALLSTDTKIHQASLLSGKRIEIPTTLYMDIDNWFDAYSAVSKFVGRPFVFKDNSGLKGRNNFLIKNKQQFLDALSFAKEQGLQMVAQEFIPNDGYYRLVVMGSQVVLAMHRRVDTSKSHLYKKSRDGEATIIDLKELPIEVQDLAVRSARLLSLEIAGVDILQDKKTGVWYCLEVNNSPQLVGGAFVDQKMESLGKFFIEESKK